MRAVATLTVIFAGLGALVLAAMATWEWIERRDPVAIVMGFASAAIAALCFAAASP